MRNYPDAHCNGCQKNCGIFLDYNWEKHCFFAYKIGEENVSTFLDTDGARHQLGDKFYSAALEQAYKICEKCKDKVAKVR